MKSESCRECGQFIPKQFEGVATEYCSPECLEASDNTPKAPSPWQPRKWLLTSEGLAGIYQTVFNCENEAMAYKAQLYPQVCPVDEYVHKDEVTHLLAEAVREAKASAYQEAIDHIFDECLEGAGSLERMLYARIAELRKGATPENGGKE